MAKWSKRRERTFLRHLAETGNVSAAARAAGLDRAEAYRRRQYNAHFAGQWQAALDEALDLLEGQLRERAMTGTEKPVFYGGKACGSVRNYSDSLAMFLLRAHRPGVYGGGKQSAAPERGDTGPAGAKARAELISRLEALVAKAESR